MNAEKLIEDLERAACESDEAAEELAMTGDTSDSRHEDGKATAYRRAAEMVRAAMEVCR